MPGFGVPDQRATRSGQNPAEQPHPIPLELALPSALAQTQVRVIWEPQEALKVSVVDDGIPDVLHLEVTAAPSVSIVQRGVELPHLIVDRSNSGTPLHVGCISEIGTPRTPTHLDLRNGQFDLRGNTPPQILALDNAQIDARARWEVGRLELLQENTVHYEMHADEVVAGVSSALKIGQVFSCTTLSAGSGCQELALEGSREFTILSQPSLKRLRMRNVVVQMGTSAGESRISGMTFIGSGSVIAVGELSESEFKPEGGPLTLSIPSGKEAIDVFGKAAVSAVQGSVCAGLKNRPLKLTQVLDANGSEFQEVDLFALTLRDVVPMSELERLGPWFPTSLKELRARADAMTHGTTDPDLQKSRNAHFWSRMSVILNDTHAPGNAQSKARYLAARARRRAAPWGREKILLSLYSAVGYGETILRPAIILPALAVIATALKMIFGKGGDPAIPDTLLGYLLAPLTFFRASTVLPPPSEDTLPTLGLTALTIVELLLLFFLLSAIRRVTKAE
jgi:hypothetical protein